MDEYKREDIKKIENVAYLDGFEQGIINTLSFFDNLDTYSHESLIIHKLATDPDLTAEVKECIQDWTNRMINHCIVTLADKEACDEG